MNRDTIKMLAMATMLVNHIANVFMPAGAPLTDLCLYIGYFTAVTMCYFLVEGYSYTHSKTNYAGRLLGFAVLAQLPYQLAFPDHGMGGSIQFNMLFTLLLCFLVLAAQEKIHNGFLRTVCIVLLIFASSSAIGHCWPRCLRCCLPGPKTPACANTLPLAWRRCCTAAWYG